jgi:hypothetical protein
MTDCSLGKCPRARTARRNRALRDSIAFVEQITRRISTSSSFERDELKPRPPATAG